MAEPVLSVQALCKSFGALVATDSVSLTLAPGEIHALIGPNGAGKSTLIKQIAGEMKPDAGRIGFLGHDITALDVAARARLGLGRSFQVSAVIPDFSVLQNVALAIVGARGRALRFFANVVATNGLQDRAASYITRVGLGGRENMLAADLAHGERRRLELAMALALEPKAFLLDEPMAGMGADGVAEMTTLLGILRNEAPILLIEHDMDAVFALADRVSVLVYGAIIASGTVAEIRADPVVRQAYLGDEAGG